MLGSTVHVVIGPVAFPGLCREVKPGVDPVTPGAAPWLRLSPTPSLPLLPPPRDPVGSFLVLSCVLIGLLYAVPPVSFLVPLRRQCCLREAPPLSCRGQGDLRKRTREGRGESWEPFPVTRCMRGAQGLRAVS